MTVKKKMAGSPKAAAPKAAAPVKAKPEDGRWERFCLEYLVDYNGARAYIRAGYEVKDLAVAAAAASRLLRNVKIQARVAELEKELLEDLRIGPARVLREASRVAFSDPSHLIAEDGTLKPLSELDPDTRASIASVEVFEEYEGTGDKRKLIGFTKKVKLWDKNQAVNALMKHKGLFEQDNDQLGRAIARAIIVPAKVPVGSGST